MSRSRIRVINPNSNRVVTKALDDALKPLAFADGPEIVCETLDEGPYGIESQADADSVIMPLRRLIESDNRSAAFVIACYSDPGLHACREATERPVFGIVARGNVWRHRDRPAVDPSPYSLSPADAAHGADGG
jgi:Asp/Glu/hydantoin racemase